MWERRRISQFTPKKRRGLLSGSSSRSRLAGFALLAIILAACSMDGSAGQATRDSEPLAASATLPSVESPTPTEAPDAMIEASQNLPEGSGAIAKEGNSWIFNSPLEAEIGKNVPVKILEHTYGDGTKENWIALVSHSEWPLFIQNEQGEWETALEYVEVKNPLVDEEGNALKLGCEDSIQEQGSYLKCIVVSNGEVFEEEGVRYLPGAISLDGEYDSPMYVNFTIPEEVDWFIDVLTYKNRIYRQDGPSSGRQQIKNALNTLTLPKGDVFFVQFLYDVPGLEDLIKEFESEGKIDVVARFEHIKENRSRVNEVFNSILSSKYNPLMQERLDLWLTFIIGVGK